MNRKSKSKNSKRYRRAYSKDWTRDLASSRISHKDIRCALISKSSSRCATTTRSALTRKSNTHSNNKSVETVSIRYSTFWSQWQIGTRAGELHWLLIRIPRSTISILTIRVHCKITIGFKLWIYRCLGWKTCRNTKISNRTKRTNRWRHMRKQLAWSPIIWDTYHQQNRTNLRLRVHS